MTPENLATAADTIARAKARDAKGAAAWEAVKADTHVATLRQSFALASSRYDRAAGRWLHPLAPKLAPVKPVGLLLNLAEKWTRLDRDDDRTSTPTPWARRAAAIAQAQADRDFLDRCRAETGDAAGPKHEKQKRERAELLAQSHQLARRLESAGTPAYRKDGANLWVYWVCSGQAEILPQFRRICFLPTVSAQVRSAKLAALEYFIAQNPFCRFWTFTSGKRVGLGGLRARVEWLHSKLNALNQFLRKYWSFELVFRSTELGGLEFDDQGNSKGEDTAGRIEFDAQGAPLFHPHAHCVVQSLCGYRKPADWSALCAAVWKFWKDDEENQLNWDGGRKGQSGVIRNARECCKYITKPGDLLKLSSLHLAETERALHGLHLVQPLGQLKAEISARRKAGKVLARVATPDGSVWVEKVDWNKFAEESAEEKAGRENLADASLMARETAAAARVQAPQAPRPIDDAAPWCRVFARLAPAVGPKGVKEARVIIGGSAFHRRTVQTHPLVSRLWAQTVQQYENGLAAERAAVFGAAWRGSGISVHTGTLTATGESPPDGPEPDESWETASPVEMLADFAAR